MIKDYIKNKFYLDSIDNRMSDDITKLRPDASGSIHVKEIKDYLTSEERLSLKKKSKAFSIIEIVAYSIIVILLLYV